MSDCRSHRERLEALAREVAPLVTFSVVCSRKGVHVDAVKGGRYAFTNIHGVRCSDVRDDVFKLECAALAKEVS